MTRSCLTIYSGPCCPGAKTLGHNLRNMFNYGKAIYLSLPLFQEMRYWDRPMVQLNILSLAVTVKDVLYGNDISLATSCNPCFFLLLPTVIWNRGDWTYTSASLLMNPSMHIAMNLSNLLLNQLTLPSSTISWGNKFQNFTSCSADYFLSLAVVLFWAPLNAISDCCVTHTHIFVCSF